ncbi:hypothetical protein F1721_32850 [Saccharopolyspora hirsuta]|uniref:Uncharacterized protein n=1 Tax=Saccharopolyspora hirsuta TaxID=1837 RepID=A0A5M7BAM2_SACHI|nr:hypothetical protein [Saccharopolyspora hirsuta]KAA5825428.1 hypothetical protein F1721_32850 [Saccharopolyspora hirsuta]
MAESPEHKFLSEAVLEIAQEVATSRLYGYREADRRKFDFSCDLATSWKKLISGQTVWKHAEGIDKDIRTLLSDVESDVLVYIARDTIKNRSTLRESVSDFKNTALAEKISRLRVFWIPEGFDADREDHRILVYGDLKESISKDLLLYTVLGGISSGDIASFTNWCNASGRALGALVEIGRSGFQNNTALAKALEMRADRTKEWVILLSATGFIERERETAGAVYRISPKGQALLDICGRLYCDPDALEDGNSALRYVCALLGINADELERWIPAYGHLLDANAEEFKRANPRFDTPAVRLACEIQAAVKYFGCVFSSPSYS